MNAEPRLTPKSDPVPFAGLILQPGATAFWPVYPKGAENDDMLKPNREIAYRDTDGAVHGSPSRRFLADRGDATVIFALQASGKLRYHVGIDLYAVPGDKVLAIAAGRIVSFYPFYAAASGQMTYALFVEHNGVVCNYGEVTADTAAKLGLAVGEEVFGGQWIGVVSDTKMLHFETYEIGTVKNLRWMQDGTPRPPALQNPTKLLLWLSENAV